MGKILILVSLFGSSVILFNMFPKKTSDVEDSTKLQSCPDLWIENRMPIVDDKLKSKNNQYFIFDGERKEIEKYDLDWILANCDIKPQIVY